MIDDNELLRFFLGRRVLIKSEEFLTEGRLLAYEKSSKQNHRPAVLILEKNDGQKMLVRGNFQLIGVGRNK